MHPLAAILIGFLLTALIGGILAAVGIFLVSLIASCDWTDRRNVIQARWIVTIASFIIAAMYVISKIAQEVHQ